MRTKNLLLSGKILILITIVCSFSITAFAIPSDSLTNVVQWKSSEGGNDHWYGIIPLVKPWVEQRTIAESFSLAGQPGYLVSITSAAENQFIFDNILTDNTEQPSVADEFYIGGHDSLGWRWLNGDLMSYSNWATGEPSGDGTGLAIWGASQGTRAGKWNDVPSDTVGVGGIHQLWAIVEFDAPSINPQDSLINLVFWSSTEGGNDHWYGVLSLLQPWNNHTILSQSLVYDGLSGAMATITSADENQFIIDNILTNVTGAGSDEFYLGGTTSGWNNGADLTYTNWDNGEPNADGIAIAINGASYGAGSGTWKDLPHDGPFGSANQLYSIVEFGDTLIPTYNPQDSLISVVQWPVTDGGNDHWYGVLAVKQPWTFHETDVQSITYNGLSGYMTTVTSANENQFIQDNVLSSVTGAGTDEFFLGGTTTEGWLNGESSFYTNWASGEPNGDGIAIAMWGSSFVTNVGKWNDLPHNGPVGSVYQLYALVEFGEPDTTTIVVDTIIDIVQWSSADGGNDHWYGIIPVPLTWDDHRTSAENIEYNGETGYLATITSTAENQFIHFNLLKNHQTQTNGIDQFFIGGFDSLGWQWTNGEPFDYENWNFGEPSGNGTAISVYGASTINSGEWNDVPQDHSIGINNQLWSIIEFGSPETLQQDSIINLIQWSSAEGGNDHWYGVFAVLQPWSEHITEIESIVYNGEQGYLSAINSLEENEFIKANILSTTVGGGAADEFFLGGTTTDGWTNGEEFTYSNWSSGEPSGDGIAIAIWGDDADWKFGRWNDVPENGPVGSINELFAIVEFGGLPTPSADTLIIESMTAVYGSNTISASVKLTQPIKGATIPIKIPDGMNILSVNTSGLITDNWDYKVIQNKADDSGFIFVSLANSFGAVIPVGETNIFNITFSGTSYSCENTMIVRFDTTLSSDVSRRLTFVDTLSLPIYPHFDKNRDQIELPPLLTGDVDTNAIIDIADLVALIDYMFNGGPAPIHINSIDINGDCQGPDIADLVRFVEFMFLNGPPLPCGCIEGANP